MPKQTSDVQISIAKIVPQAGSTSDPECIVCIVLYSSLGSTWVYDPKVLGQVLPRGMSLRRSTLKGTRAIITSRGSNTVIKSSFTCFTRFAKILHDSGIVRGRKGEHGPHIDWPRTFASTARCPAR